MTLDLNLAVLPKALTHIERHTNGNEWRRNSHWKGLVKTTSFIFWFCEEKVPRDYLVFPK